MGLRLINVASFQIGWLACVLGARWGYPLLGPVLVAFLVILHVVLNGRAAAEIRLAALAASLGFLTDSFLLQLEAFRFNATENGGLLSTPWMVALWANYAVTLRSSMAWLQGRLVAGTLLGGLCGPLAYLAGARLEVIVVSGWTGFAAIGIAWAFMVPFLSWMATGGEPNGNSFRQLPEVG